MYRVLNCLTTQHDYRLVVLAAVICVIACITAFLILSRQSATERFRRAGWVFLAGLAAGSGIWTTHFVAMLAYEPGMPIAYDPVLTAASLLIAVFMTGCGFFIAGSEGSNWQAAAGGALVGAGISSMHFTGMHAVEIGGVIEWDATLVVASIVLGVCTGSASTLAYRNLSEARAPWIAAGVLALAICAMHFTAMGAAVVVPDPTVEVTPSFVNNDVMALAVAGVTLLVILSGLSAALIDGQTRKEAFTRLYELANAATEGIVVAKDGVIVDVNDRVLQISGLAAGDLRGKRVFGDLIAIPGDAGEKADCEAFLRTADGGKVPIEVTVRPFSSGERANEVYALRDLRERRAAQTRIRFLAHHDALTGLPNRAALSNKLESVLQLAGKTATSFAVLYVDLDRFKDVNDVYGHAAGDQVLCATAERLKSSLRAGDIVGRVGGDEFVIIQTRRAQPEAAEALANRLIESFQETFEADGQLIQLGVSIGIAIHPQNGSTAQELLGSADIALYRAKSDGRNCARFFDLSMDEAHRSRKRLSQDLRGAISGNQFELQYQPQFKVGTGELFGFEALLRWRHPVQGLISPGDFIPLAEETGLIVPVGEWVIRAACAEASLWAKPYRIAVNLSPKQLQQAGLPQLVHRILLETGLAPSRLEFEVTESALIQDSQRALDVLRRLKALGVTIAMDDFGTGYSSLSTLQSFPFDKLKIDRSFVGSLGSGKQADSIVKSVLSLGHSLDIPVLAEGVETVRQYRYLSDQQCDEVQGYFFGKPMPAEQARHLIEQGAAFPRDQVRADAGEPSLLAS